MSKIARRAGDHHRGRASLRAIGSAIRVVPATARNEQESRDDKQCEATGDVVKPFSTSKEFVVSLSCDKQAEKSQGGYRKQRSENASGEVHRHP